VRLGRLGAAGVLAVVVVPLGAPAAGAQTTITPEQCAAFVAAKQISGGAVRDCLQLAAIDASDLTVTGAVDLRPLGTVDHPIRCQRCHLQGDLRIADVTFTRAIDFDGVLIDGNIDARGATFQAPVLARAEPSTPSGVTGTADFSLATFADAVTFDDLSFGKSAKFDGARFESSVSFQGAQFGADAQFERVAVEGFFVMSGPGAVQQETSLRDGVFHGTVDLESRQFVGGLNGAGADFTGRTNLSRATFGASGGTDGLVLDGASFADVDASGATFSSPAFVRLAHATALNLNQAVALAGLNLQGTQVDGPASFDGAQLQGALDLEKFAASQIVLDIGALGNVASGPARRSILSKIERTAREAGDIQLANDARFRLLQVDGRNSAFPKREVDWVFYEQLGGYLVRPLRPLRALFVLILIGTAARYVVDRHRERTGQLAVVGNGVGAMGRRVRLGHEITGFLGRFSRAVIASLRPKPNITSPVGETTVEPYVIAGLRLFEYVASKLLIVVFFLCLGNYNATLRDVLGSVKL
jgi:Pentapeptide repeats (9 copies)